MNKSIRKHREIMKKERNIYVKLFNVIFNSGIYTRTVAIGEMSFQFTKIKEVNLIYNYLHQLPLLAVFTKYLHCF